MLSELKSVNIMDTVDFHKMCLFYKYRTRLVPEYLQKHSVTYGIKHEHHTRTRTCQSLNQVKHNKLVKHSDNQLKRLFKYSGALNWNDLNPVIRHATSLNIFTSVHLRSHFSN